MDNARPWDLVIATEDAVIRRRVTASFDGAGLGYSVITPAEVSKLPLRQDDFGHTFFVLETSDVVTLVQTVWDLYEIDRSGMALGLVGMLSHQSAGWNKSMGVWIVGGHAAVLAMTDLADPRNTQGLTRMLLDDGGSRPADELLSRRRTDSERPMAAPLRPAVAVAICGQEFCGPDECRVTLAITDGGLRRRVGRALSQSGFCVDDVDPRRLASRLSGREIIVVGTGRDVFLLVQMCNYLYRCNEDLPDALPVIAVVPSDALTLSPALRSWVIAGRPAVHVLLEADRPTVAESVVRAALQACGRSSGTGT